MDIRGKVALVTGGAVRIGKAMALGLAEEGCHVVIHYDRSASAALETVSEIEARGVKAWPTAADFNDEEAVQALIPAVLQQTGRLDILINNASIFPREDFFTTDAASWNQNMAINLKAPFLLSQAFAAALPEDRPGAIINMLDSIALRPKNHHFAYTISKFGLEGLTRATAFALAGRNIQVNGIALGTILAADEGDQAVFERMAKRTPMQHPGSPQAVVKTLLYLLQAAEYVTGEVIRVDGGRHLV
ncbi:MAG: SDR family oxidoreductase [Anaerolineae bacterium]|nr:SDR family oxidoreductase [Anaerolineae bacterium]